MNFDDYKPKLKYPTKHDFTTTYFYRHGECIATVRPGEQTPEIGQGALIERVVNEDAFRAARNEYNKHVKALEEQFVIDLFEDAGVPDNEFTRKIYSIAYDQTHSGGLSSVASCFDDLSGLDTLARKVYDK